MMKRYQKILEPASSILIKKYPLSGKRKYEDFIFGLAVVLTIFPFILIAFYNHPSADDFCYSVNSMDMGFWEAQKDYYLTWTGRYMATALLTVNPIDYHDLTGYKVLSVILLILFGASIYLFLKKLLPFVSSTDRQVLSFIIYFLYLVKTPTISEAFYWMAASITYQLASILMLVLFSIILHLKEQKERPKKIFYTFLGSLFCIATIGLNETSMIMLCIILFLWLVISSYLQRSLDVSLLVLLLVTIAASGVVVLAPGNAVRMSVKPEKFQFLFSLSGSLKVAILYIKKWLSIAVLLVLFFIGLLSRIAANIRDHYHLPKFSLLHIFLLALFLFGFIVLCFFPSFWSQGGEPPARTVNTIYLLFIFGGFMLVLAFLLYLQNQQFTIPRPSYFFRGIVGLLILFLMVQKSNNIKTAYHDLVKGTARKYSLEMQERYAQLSNCAADSCTVPFLVHRPPTIYAFELASKPSEEVYYYNQCLSAYFNKQYIAIPPQ